MASRTCENCGASVASDEQFCPNCGNFIDPLTKNHDHNPDNVIAVNSDGKYDDVSGDARSTDEQFALGEEPPAETAPEGVPTEPRRNVTCPSCNALNPPNNRHCQECGARISQKPLPTAPRPAVQATAGVRAALAISGLLFVVIVIALVFNVFGGDGSTSTTVVAVTTTTPVVETPGPIEILSSECDPEGIGAFTCTNLETAEGEYQITWEDLEEGENVTVRLTFRVPMTVTRIDWTNLEDPTRFKQNYRVRGVVIDAQNALQAFPKELEDVPGTQTFGYAAVNANWIEFTIESAYAAEVTDGNVFRELAIQQISIIGRPANATS